MVYPPIEDIGGPMAIHKSRDNSFKLILGDHELFAEFLRDFIPIDLLRHVRAEDIEDMSERFLPLFQNNRDSDTVKRITLKGDASLFVIAIVEHESAVNYRAPFKMLQYITLVLDAYEKEANRDRPGISTTKDFRYPPVLPVIFYDGRAPWTAAVNFAGRTALEDIFYRYIPKFDYELVDLNRYAYEDLTRFGDILSILMIIDKVGKRDRTKLLDKLPGYVEGLSLNIPPNLTKLLGDVITVLLNRVEVGEEEIGAITGLIVKQGGQKMFDSFVEAVLEEKRIAKEEGFRLGTEEGIRLGTEEGFRLGTEEGIRLGTEEGFRLGTEESIRICTEKAYQEKLESARKFKKKGYPVEDIADSVGLSPDTVGAL
jgi:hypothetical protein